VSQNIILPIIIVSMSVVGTALGLYAMARELAGGKVASTSTKATRFNSGGETECILISLTAETIVLDILIAGLMCWALYRKKTGLARTDSMIMTLMAYTVNTGLLTA
jgi:NADH:ubiquinone oxidoreductase subunit 3 (subunit A)